MPYSLTPYREAITAPQVRNQMLTGGWLCALDQQPPAGSFVMVIALDELTGETLKGAGAYDASASWVTRNLDTGAPRTTPGTGWVFLDLKTGACLIDKMVYYYKPFSKKAMNRPSFPWVQILTT